MLRCGEGVRSTAEASAGGVTRSLLAVVPQGRHRNRRHASPVMPTPHCPVLPSGQGFHLPSASNCHPSPVFSSLPANRLFFTLLMSAVNAQARTCPSFASPGSEYAMIGDSVQMLLHPVSHDMQRVIFLQTSTFLYCSEVFVNYAHVTFLFFIL